MKERRIVAGIIRGARGVRGQARVRVFLDSPETLASVGNLLTDADGKLIPLTVEGRTGADVVVRIKNIETRDQAERLKGLELFLPRAALPCPGEGVYYESDLRGLEARDPEGVAIGHVVASHDYGAGAFLEIQPTDARTPSFMLPFTATYVPTVNLENGLITVIIPPGWRDSAKPNAQKDKL